jgi:hypothetical protein
LDCFLELNLSNQLHSSLEHQQGHGHGQGQEQQGMTFLTHGSDPQKAMKFLLSSTSSLESSQHSSELSPQALLTSVSSYHNHCQPSSPKEGSSSFSPHESCLSLPLPVSVLWMGTHLGFGQRVENGLQDWIFPPAGRITPPIPPLLSAEKVP